MIYVHFCESLLAFTLFIFSGRNGMEFSIRFFQLLNCYWPLIAQSAEGTTKVGKINRNSTCGPMIGLNMNMQIHDNSRTGQFAYLRFSIRGRRWKCRSRSRSRSRCRCRCIRSFWQLQSQCITHNPTDEITVMMNGTKKKLMIIDT